jgi:CheY-like chemotaxis protein
VGLFSEQISEQLDRLRSLARGVGGATDEVALRRAVMATRLLSGSARILRFSQVQTFLDLLVRWLQRVESAGNILTPTQSVLLEGVIELEETLMRALDAGEVDLEPLAEDLEDVAGLLRRHLEGPARPQRPVPAGPPDSAAVTPPAPEEEETAPAPEPVREVESAPAPESTPPPAPAPLPTPPAALDPVAAFAARLDALAGGAAPSAEEHRALGEIHRRLSAFLHPDPTPTGGPRPATPPPEREEDHSDAVRAGILHLLRERHEQLHGWLDYDVDGVGGDLPESVVEQIHAVLFHLLGDACDHLEHMMDEEDAPPAARIRVTLSRRDHRLQVVVRDNGPRLGDAPAMDHEDPLGVYRGLRRSRALLEEMGALIRVEPADETGCRFALLLPVEPDRERYRMLDLGRSRAAVPAHLVDDLISTEGLLFHADTDGESFVHHGQQVPLIDLAQFTGEAAPLADSAEAIAIVGLVEKRLGLYCHQLGPSVEGRFEATVPPGWEETGRGRVDLGEGRPVAVLDLSRLLRFRLGAMAAGEAGSVPDPVLDAYVPAAEEKPRPESPAVSERTRTAGPLRVLLVNQSDFRRRDLGRTLEAMGYGVQPAADLNSALDHLEAGSFDLLITDLRLGDASNERLAELRRGHPDLPVVLTSSVARDYAEELARRSGVDACWVEPYLPSELRSLLSARD